MHVYRIQNVVFIVVAVTIPVTLIFLLTRGGGGYQTTLEERVSDLSYRLRYAELLNRKREDELRSLTGQIQRYVRSSLARNVSNITSAMFRDLIGNFSIKLPEAGFLSYRSLSYLHSHPEALSPEYSLSKGRKGAAVVIGVPTIKRPTKDNYLSQTLQSLMDNLDNADKQSTLIVVFVAEPNDTGHVLKTAKELQSLYPSAFESGLLEVVSPPQSFYPDLNSLPRTLGDTPERVKWRTKQVLDFAFLMIYARTRGDYYLQVEDDVITKPGYLATIKSFAKSKKSNWIYITFSSLGFIGKLFKSYELYPFVDFALMFYADKPIDWLLHHYVSTKVCNLEKDAKHCVAQMVHVGIQFKPSLFQHIGKHSSLPGKLQKLRDRFFGRQAARGIGHANPSADVSTSLKEYKMYGIQRAYVGETFFWALNPQPGDTITFRFHPAVPLYRILFRSGNQDHPNDILVNATVEVRAEKPELMPASYPLLKDSYSIVANFTAGLVDISLAPLFAAKITIASVRITCHSELDNWIIIREIYMQTSPVTSPPK